MLKRLTFRVYNLILTSCQLHSVTSEKTKHHHKQMHISKLFIYENHFASQILQKSIIRKQKKKHTYTNIKHTFL